MFSFGCLVVCICFLVVFTCVYFVYFDCFGFDWFDLGWLVVCVLLGLSLF